MTQLEKMASFLRNNPDANRKEIAEALDVQLNTVSIYINRALQKGLIERSGRNKYRVADYDAHSLLKYIEAQQERIEALQEANDVLTQTRDLLYYGLTMDTKRGYKTVITA